MRRLSLYLSIVLTVMLSAAIAHAQFSAGVQGTVADPAGAAIPNVTVTLTNVETGVQRTAVSNHSGVYRFVSLGPGEYTVSASLKGFAPAKVAFTLTPAQTLNVPLPLKVASVSSTVQVTAQAPLLDTSDSRLEYTLSTAALANLPIAGRNPTAVISVTPGVTGLGTVGQGINGSSGGLNFNTENLASYSANGQGQNGNQYIVDGMDVTSTIRPGVLNLTPNADVVRNVTVQTNTYTVDYGRAGSIQTVMSTKSGTNQFHGLASLYYTSQQLAARGEFGVPQPTPVSPYHSDNMSFTLGGPIIPHKQFFFFVGYEPYLSLTSNGTGLVSFEDPAFVKFAQQTVPQNPEVTLMTKYPVAGVVNTKVSATAGQLYGNTLSTPGARTACANGTGTITAYDGLSVPCSLPVFDTANFNSSSYENAYQYNIRIDKDFRHDRIFGQFFRDNTNSGGPSLRPAFATTAVAHTFSLQGNETHIFSPRTLNQAIFGYRRVEGISPKTGLYTVPIVSVDQLGTGWGDGFADGDFIQHSYHWRDVLTHLVGSHSIKAGFNIWRSDDIALFAGTEDQPNLFYKNMIDFIANNPYSETGISYDPITGKFKPHNYGYKETTYGMFVEDTWKATRRLTLNYGLRYDNFGNPYPALKGTVLANFHLATGPDFASRVADGIMTQQSHVFNGSRNWIFSPRAGVAYNLFGNGKWVARGGIGLYHNEFTLGNSENGLGGNPPGPVVPTFFNDGSTAPPIFSFGTQNTMPFGFQVPEFGGTPLDAKGGIAGSQIGVGGVDENLITPSTLNWSAELAHQLTRNFVVSVGYAGTHSWNLVLGGVNPGATAYGGDVNIFPGDLIQHPVFNSSGVWTGDGIQTRLNHSFGSIGYAFNAARANYNAVIVAINGHLGARGFVVASYARSHAMDNWGDYPEGYVAGGGKSYDINQWYSPSSLNTPNRFSLGWSYVIPGVTHGNGFMQRLTNGFTLSSTTVLQSGTPFFVYNGNPMHLIDTAGVTVTQSNYQSELSAGHFAFAPNSGNYAADGDNFNIPDVVSYKQKHDRKSYEYTGVANSGIITRAQFAQPKFVATGTEGNEKLNRFTNPGYADADLSVMKTTSITERFKLQLRWDIFNLFNRVNLNGVDTNYGDTSAHFGTTDSNLPARNMNLAVRLTF